jgi:transposase
LLDYKDQYLAWMVNFDIPFTNNLAERSLRGAKSKMKASGQFQNIDRASDYANIKSYLETCVRNGINGFRAFVALAAGLPLKLKDVLAEGLERNKIRDLGAPQVEAEIK